MSTHLVAKLRNLQRLNCMPPRVSEVLIVVIGLGWVGLSWAGLGYAVVRSAKLRCVLC